MAANVEEIVVSARVFPNVLALPKSAKIGDIEIQTSIEEVYEDRLEITEHPVQSGAAITDHAYSRPPQLRLRCGWSNSSLKALTGIVTGFFSGGTMSKSDYVGGIYSQLLKLQQSREPVSITTGLRTYDNMLVQHLSVTRDQKTSSVLMVQAECRQIIIVSTQSTSLPAKNSQASPADTAGVEDVGAKQAASDTPAPGGSVPIH